MLFRSRVCSSKRFACSCARLRRALSYGTIMPTYRVSINMKYFFLTENEKKVFMALSKDGTSATKISLLAKIPRTSALKALNSLEKIGLATSRKIRTKNQKLFHFSATVKCDSRSWQVGFNGRDCGLFRLLSSATTDSSGHTCGFANPGWR